MGHLRVIAGLLILYTHRRVLCFVPAGGLPASGAPTKVCHPSRTTRFSFARPLAMNLSDGVSETRRVKFVASSTPGNQAKDGTKERGDTTLQTVNKRLLAQIKQQGEGITIPTEESKRIQRREEDLNGVNPFYAILGAGVAGAMSFGSWKATVWFADKYFNHRGPDSDILAVARLTAFIKQAVVGMFALGSGIFGVNALGMGIMAGIVAVGVIKGELDPSPGATRSKTPLAGASPEEVDRFLLKEAEEKLRKAEADIEREIGGKI